MKRPRIIIADRELGYVSTLLNELVRELGNRADIELITEKDYFADLFSKGQKADALIVSEELWMDSLKMHEIVGIFVINDESEQAFGDESGIKSIYRYSNIKLVCREIIDKCCPHITEEAKRESTVIVVTSAAGGEGKTTIGLGMCECLSESGFSVLYVNTGGIQYFQYLFDDKAPILDNGVYAKLISSGDKYEAVKKEIRKESFMFLPAFKAAPASLGIKQGVYTEIIESAKEKNIYDYIVVDTGNDFGTEKINLISTADKVVIVTEQRKRNAYALKALMSNLSVSDYDKYFIVCNRYRKDKENELEYGIVDSAVKIDGYVIEMGKDVENKKELKEIKDLNNIAFMVL